MDAVRFMLGLAAAAAGVTGCPRDAQPPMATKSVAQLVEESVGEDGLARGAALGALSSRSSSEAVAGLVARLRDPDPEVVARSIEALVALHQEAAVSGLIELSREDRPGLVLQAIVAIGQIGGREAEGYLFTLETGGSEDTVRRTAAQARLQLGRRRAAKIAARGNGAQGP